MAGPVRTALVAVSAVAAAALVAAQVAAAPAPGRTELVSLSSAQEQGNQDSELSSTSADGRFVAFASLADNLVPGDTNVASDIFVRDRRTGKTERVSVSSLGAEGDRDSGFLNGMAGPSISANGRWVVFDSEAGNLVLNDTNGSSDVFIYDRLTGMTKLVSVSADGTHAATGFDGSISDDGDRVAFISFADDIVQPDTNFASDVFVRDLDRGRTVRVSDAPDGSQANNTSFAPHLDFDGDLVEFESFATNLVRGDDDSLDVFVHNLRTGRTEGISVQPGQSSGVNVRGGDGDISANGRFVVFSSQDETLVPGDDARFQQDVVLFDRFRDKYEIVSVDSRGRQGDDNSKDGAVSADGRFVAFTSFATNLVPEDENFRDDVFVRDRANDTTKRVSVGRHNAEGDLNSGAASIDFDGGVIAFTSAASTFVREHNQAFFANDIFVRDASRADDD
jgi:Tol biopolymer transport system component